VRHLLLWHAEGTDIDQMMLALSTYMGQAEIFYTYWYLSAFRELMALAGGKFERFADLARETGMNRRTKAPPSFAALVQAWFAEYLTQQRALNGQNIAAYRDSFVLFLDFVEASLGKSPPTMALADMTPELIMAFLDQLERQRHNCVLTRKARLAALRSFLKFAAHRDVASINNLA
jgi:hypothetical protein